MSKYQREVLVGGGRKNGVSESRLLAHVNEPQTTNEHGVVTFPTLSLRGPSNATTTVLAYGVYPVTGHVCRAPLYDVLVTDVTASVEILTNTTEGKPLFCPEPRWEMVGDNRDDRDVVVLLQSFLTSVKLQNV